MTTIGILLEPLDVLFFRDGKPFEPSTRAGGAWPVPQTLAGAVTTALLQQHDCDFNRFKAALNSGLEAAVVNGCGEAQRWIAGIAVRGPWLARTGSSSSQEIAHGTSNAVEVLCPIPATVHKEKKEKGAEPARLHLVTPLNGNQSRVGWALERPATDRLRPLWRSGRETTELASGFLTPAGLARFLQGQCPQPGQLISAEKLYSYDHRTGIAIEPDRLTAAEGMIYGASFLSLNCRARLKQSEKLFDVAFYAELVVPDEAPAGVLDGIQTLSLGGEGRRVAVRSLPRPCAWDDVANPAVGHSPTLGSDGKTQRPFLLLTTPGLFDGRWYPECLKGRLVAAAVPACVAVSGWDLARGGPKPTRFAVPAGSVYFLDELPQNLGRSLCDHALDRQQGWGCYLKGTWTDD